MNKTLMSVLLLVTCVIPLSAQQAENQTTAAAAASTETSAAAKNLQIQSGTQLSGELQKTIDVRKAKVGDPVVLKTTKAIKSEGRKIVHKGAKLHGQVTEVTQKTKSNAASSISILFDRLEDGSLSIPITATISSITKVHSNTTNGFRSESEAQSASGASMQSAPASGRGGLVGGVTNTVGGAVNSSTGTVGNVVGGATSTTGSVVGTTGDVVGSSTAGLSGSLSKIQISESSSTSASGTSILSLTGENLRVEKGATFNLVVTQSTSAEISRQP